MDYETRMSIQALAAVKRLKNNSKPLTESEMNLLVIACESMLEVGKMRGHSLSDGINLELTDILGSLVVVMMTTEEEPELNG